MEWYHIRFACGRPWVQIPVCPFYDSWQGAYFEMAGDAIHSAPISILSRTCLRGTYVNRRVRFWRVNMIVWPTHTHTKQPELTTTRHHPNHAKQTGASWTSKVLCFPIAIMGIGSPNTQGHTKSSLFKSVQDCHLAPWPNG